MLRQELARKVSDVLHRLIADGDLPEAARVEFEILDTKNPEHGDYSCNLALIAAKPAGMNPRAIGEKLQKALAADDAFNAVDIAGPGFLNFKLKPETISRYVSEVLSLGEKLPSALSLNTQHSTLSKLEVEFVSVNPNGPITVGSGRGAAFGDTYSRILRAAGNEVTREYYINDGVNSEQMRLFAESVRHYYSELIGIQSEFPEKGYKGEYVKRVAERLERRSFSKEDQRFRAAIIIMYVLSKDLPEMLSMDSIENAPDKLPLKMRADFSSEPITYEVLIKRDFLESPPLSPDQAVLLDSIKHKTQVVVDLKEKLQFATDALALMLIVTAKQDGHDLGRKGALRLADSFIERYVGLWNNSPLKPGFRTEDHIGEKVWTALQSAMSLYAKHGTKARSESADWFQEQSQDLMLDQQREDLSVFGVNFDIWFSEQKDLHEKNKVIEALQWLEQNGNAYRAVKPRVVETPEDAKKPKAITEGDEDDVVEDGKEALWLASSSNNLGDDKDRVLLRADGRPTYLAAEVAYLKDKFDRGYDKCYLVLGPDHHGYIGRTYAVVKALGKEPGKDFEIIIFQIVRFVKDGQPAPMRKRDGNIYELRDLITELGQAVSPNATPEEQQNTGRDVARFFYLMRSHETHMDFDIDLATKQSDENPVFYVQYAHARICGVIRKALGSGLEARGSDINTSLLIHPRELALIKKIIDLPEEVQRCAKDFGVHRIATFAVELARSFHAFYDACRVIQPEEPELSQARLALAKAAQIGLKSALDLLGVSAPEKMERAELQVTEVVQ